MSVTGPGCAHCDFTGTVPWSADRPHSLKPCDRCGGFSQFAAHAPPSWPSPELAAHLARRRTCEECRDWASHRGTDGPHHELCSKAGAP